MIPYGNPNRSLVLASSLHLACTISLFGLSILFNIPGLPSLNFIRYVTTHVNHTTLCSFIRIANEIKREKLAKDKARKKLLNHP